MPGLAPVADDQGPLSYRDPALNEGCRASAALATKAPFALAAGQVTAPVPVRGAGDLGVDEAINALIGDDRVAAFAFEAAGDLLGGAAALEIGQDPVTQVGLALQT